MTKSTIRRRADRLDPSGKLWKQITLLRDKFKRENGFNPKQAIAMAGEQILLPAEKQHMREEADRHGLQVDDAWTINRQLVDPSEFKSLTGSTRQTVEWVADNIACYVKPADCPSPQAWALLMWVRNPRQPENEDRFWQNIYPRLSPPMSALVSEDRFRDDGRELDKFIDDALKFEDAA